MIDKVRQTLKRSAAVALVPHHRQMVHLCRVCQSETQPFQTAFGRLWYKCPDCGFLQAELTKTMLRQIQAGEGLSAGTGVGGGGYREYYIAKLCCDELHLGSVLLYGTGNTSTLEKLRSEGVDARGCDLSPELIRIRQEQHGTESFFHPSEFPQFHFDVIVAVEVFEHFWAPMRSLRLLRDHLYEDGVIAGTTDFYESGGISDHAYLSPPFHVAYWSQRSLETAAATLGLQLTLFELECPGSVKPDERFGLLWPRKRVFFLHPETHRKYFLTLQRQHTILPIDRP